MTLENAIATIEGWYAKGKSPNRPQRNNNPGNIQWGEFARAHGADRVEDGPNGRFAHFPTAIAGEKALRALLLSPSYCDLTIEQAIDRYAPPTENSTQNYVYFVCKQVGCTPHDLVREVMS